MSSAPATDPVAPGQTAPTAPKTNEQKARDLAEKHGVLDKLKKAIYKKFGLKPGPTH